MLKKVVVDGMDIKICITFFIHKGAAELVLSNHSLPRSSAQWQHHNQCGDRLSLSKGNKVCTDWEKVVAVGLHAANSPAHMCLVSTPWNKQERPLHPPVVFCCELFIFLFIVFLMCFSLFSFSSHQLYLFTFDKGSHTSTFLNQGQTTDLCPSRNALN